jgi:hypothetical protein
MAIKAQLLEKLNAAFPQAPIVAGDNVFTTAEYGEAVGLQRAQTLVRLGRLEQRGEIKKVRTRRDGRIMPAWLYVGKAKK